VVCLKTAMDRTHPKLSLKLSHWYLTHSVEFPNPYVRYAPSRVHVHEMDGAAHTSNIVVTSFDEAFRHEWQHFHQCVTTGAAPRTNAADALRDIEILRAIVRCAADGVPASL
jgi:predicted dehydrogenase